MKIFNIDFKFANGEHSHVRMESETADAVAKKVTGYQWFRNEENGEVLSVNMNNVLEIKVNEVDEDFHLGDIKF